MAGDEPRVVLTGTDHRHPLPALSTVDPQLTSVSSMSELAYLILRDQIVTAQILPGAVIEEKVLSDGLQLGRTPVREALSLLTNERLVTTMLRRGRIVSEIGVSDVRDVYEAREILEVPAARLAAERATADDKLRATALMGELERHRGLPDVERELLRLDYQAHALAYRCTRNVLFERSLVRYLNLAARLWYVNIDAVAQARRSAGAGDPVDDPHAILAAIAAGDPDAAEHAAHAHLRRSHAKIVDLL